MDDAVKTRGIIYWNVESWFLFAPAIKIPGYAPASMCMEVTFKCRLLGLSLLLASAVLALHVAVALAWLLHHFPSSKSLDCPLSSLWTILPIDIKSRARSDDVRVMLDLVSVRWALAAVRWAFVLFSLFSLLLFHVTHVIHPSSLRFDPPGWFFWAPFGSFGCVRYRAPLKHVRPGCVRTPSVWASNRKPRWR